MPEAVSAAERERVREIVARLRKTYPDARCSLNFSTPLELLVATILAAQCTDERVNAVTATLFKKYRSAADYVNAPIETLEQDIKSTGFYRNKAKNVQGMARILVEQYNGAVPSKMDDLLRLPGVARKTANVVQGYAFGIVEGVVVDTHVGRITRRLGLTNEEDPAKVERDLMAKLDHGDWLDFSHLLIFHGRAVCRSQNPACAECVLLDLCPTGQARTKATVEASEGA
ncbi:MAG TPA: endonuclease III [Ktedonobacterales bacterium]|nr:endonuclease III [Ktedonobacterales bacterium]